MIKKYWKISLIVILLCVLGWLVYPNFKEDKYFKKIDLKTTNFVYNTTDRKYLDTIVVVGLRIQGIENTKVIIRDLKSEVVSINGSMYELNAFLLNEGSQYAIYIKDTNREESLKILSHELIHYDQCYYKRVIIKGDNVSWNGIDYTNFKGSYEDRPWEIEAYNNSEYLERLIKKVLY